MKEERIKEIREEILEKKSQLITKRVSIIYDGKQYNIRIPKDFAAKAKLDIENDEFEFTLEIPADRKEFPQLYGDLVEKEKKSGKG